MALSWIEVLLNFVKQFNPFVTVPTWARGVRVRGGKHVKELKPNIHWRWLGIDKVFFVTVVPEVINLPTQSITTKDRVEVTFSANIEYEVVDAVAKFTKVSDFDNSLVNAAMGHIAKKIRDWTYDELIDGQRKLELSLRETLTTYVRDWGVKINDVRLTDMVKARQYRLFGDPKEEST